MSDRLQELTVFVRAAESGSFSRAARELRLSQPSISRIIHELEGCDRRSSRAAQEKLPLSATRTKTVSSCSRSLIRVSNK